MKGTQESVKADGESPLIAEEDALIAGEGPVIAGGSRLIASGGPLIAGGGGLTIGGNYLLRPAYKLNGGRKGRRASCARRRALLH